MEEIEAYKKVELMKEGKLKPSENIKYFLNKIKENDHKINAILTINKEALTQAEELEKKQNKGKLYGLAIAVKANINVKNLPASCASKTLENYIAPYDADVIKFIKQEDGIIIGMANCDEFASGSTGENSAFGPTQNPAAPGYIAGGSSSGSAASVATGFCDIALGSDTGGSIRAPASNCNIYGLKPSYGSVSRYGLIDLSMSLDQIGPLAKDEKSLKLLWEVIARYSENDSIMYNKEFKEPKEKLTIGLSNEFKELCTDKKVYELIENKIKEVAKKNNLEIKNVNLKHLNLAVEAYYPIVYVEFFSGTRKFDARKYGKIIEEAAQPEVLRRILGGKEISKAEYKGTYYRKALAVKQLIKEDFLNAFKEVDVIIAPTLPCLPWKIGELQDPKAIYATDAFTIPANLAEICAGVIPIGKIENLPVGMQIFSAPFTEKNIFKLMETING